tara:strand:+ start:505 stop:831 length:327 start_codon:yes stop_codon:yes gene_type:complete
MAFKMAGFSGFKQKTKTGGSGMGAKQLEDDLIENVGTDTRTVGGRHTEVHDGKKVNPKFRDKMKQIERHLKEFKEGGATDAEVKAERERLVNDLKKHIVPSDTTGEDY